MSISRRHFLRATAATAGFAATGTGWAQTQKSPELRIAVVGVRSRGVGHINGLANHLVALCDVDEKILDNRANQVEEKTGRKILRFTDYRKLVESPEVDAISIATPNHTHCLIAIAACEAGKDVYCEKPISHNVWEGRQLVNAARRYNRIVQCGTQSRSSEALREAVEFVRNGVLGDIKYAIGTCFKPRMSVGKLTKPLRIPKHINYDLWCGPAAKVDIYRPNLHYDWHWDFNTGNGDTGNQGIHQMDIARWFLGESTIAPTTLSIGGRVGYEDAGNTPNSQIVFHQYEKAPLIFETRGLPKARAAQSTPEKWKSSMDNYRGSQVGVIIQCEDGHVLVPSYVEATAYDSDGKEINTWKQGGDHFANWLQAVITRKRSDLNAEVLEGHLSSALCHVGNISHQLGQHATKSEIDSGIEEFELFAESFERFADHLSKNGINLDVPRLTLGKKIELDTVSEASSDERVRNLLRRECRSGYNIPDFSNSIVTS